MQSIYAMVWVTRTSLSLKVKLSLNSGLYVFAVVVCNIQVHLNKLECHGKVHLFQ